MGAVQELRVSETEAEDFLTETEVAARYRDQISPGTLRNWRSQGRGPPYLKVGRQVLYPRNSLEAWERSRTHPRPRT